MKKYRKHYKELFFKKINNIDDLPNDYKAIAQYIKDNFKQVSFMDINNLSKNTNIEPYIINEYIKSIGFNNYEEFRKNLREIISSDLKTTDRFKIAMNFNNTLNNIINTVINKEIQNINHFLNSVDENKINYIVEEIANAPELIIVGTRSSSPIAIYSEYIFNRIGKKTKKIISGGTENFDFLSTNDRNALVLAFGFARYPKETIKILNFLRKRNFKIISITDNNLSPLVKFSTEYLTIPCESISFTDFFAVPMIIVNILVIATSIFDEENSLRQLNEFENIAKDLGYYF